MAMHVHKSQNGDRTQTTQTQHQGQWVRGHTGLGCSHLGEKSGSKSLFTHLHLIGVKLFPSFAKFFNGGLGLKSE